jgi:hypothetical protein
LSCRSIVVKQAQNANEQSPPFNFNLPIYAERIAQAYIDVPSPIVNRRKLQYDPKVKEFLDIEANEGEEFEIEGSTSSDCSSSDDL